MTDYIIDGDKWVRIHTDFNIASPVIGSLATGTKVAVDSIVPGTSWAKIPLSIGGAAMTSDSTSLTQVYGYMFAPLMHTVVPPPVVPPVATPPKKWRNATGINYLSKKDNAIEAVKLGCRDFVFLDWDLARWAADAIGKTAAFDGKGTVMFRHWITNWPSFDQVMGFIHPGEDGRIVRIVTNECEGLNKPGPEGILYHAELDVLVARENAKHGIHTALGTYAVGNPDITNPLIVKAMRDGYADWWNNGFAQTGVRPVWDQHEYSPTPQHIYDNWEGDLFISGRTVHAYEQDWHETRASFLFKLCGFNLKSGGVLMSSETGIDMGGKGGFLGCGVDSVGVTRWLKRNDEIWMRNVADDFGNVMPMPKESKCVFQGSDTNSGKGGWLSYFVGGMQSSFVPVWAK